MKARKPTGAHSGRGSGSSATDFLAVDIGNTALKMCLFRGAEPARSFGVLWEEFPDGIKEALMQFREQARTPFACGLCSVVPSRNSVISALLRNHLGVAPALLTHRSHFQFKNLCRPPESVGHDRLAAVQGALSLATPPFAVFSFGTALAVTVLSPEYDLVGGWIVPGFQTSVRALRTFAELLRNVNLPQPSPALGDSTSTAVSGGLLLALRGSIREMQALLLSSFGERIKFIASGGEASLVSDLFHHMDDLLVLKGIRRAVLGP